MNDRPPDSSPESPPAAPRRGALPVIFLTVLIDLIGFGIFIPLLPFYAKEFGGNTVLAGALVGTYSVVQLFFLPILGRLSDRYGRRPILLLGLGGSCVAYALFALGTWVGSLGLLFAARGLAGLFGATISTAQAYVADVTTPETRAKGMGLIGAAFGLGFTLGPPIGGRLDEAFLQWVPSGFAPAAFASLLSLVAFTLGFFRLAESHRPGEGDSRTFSLGAAVDALRERRRGILLLLFLLQVWAFANLEAMFSLLGKERFEYDKSDMGDVFLFVGLVTAFVQGGLIHRLTRGLGVRTVFAVATVGLAGGFLAVAYVTAKTPFFFACALIGVSYGMASPTLNALISRNTAGSKQGATFGVAQSAAGLGRALGHVGAGALFARESGEPFKWAGAAMLVVFGLFLIYRREFPRDLVELEAEEAAR